MTNECILVCDPDPGMQRALKVILRDAGYQVLTTGTGTEALDRAEVERPQAVILELALPDVGGVELCRHLRRHGEMAIIVLSAIDDEQVKIEALQSGADDYVTKPFSRGELVARVAARLRAAPSELRFEVDGLMVDLVARRVTVDGNEVHLTPTEFALLRVLATSRGPVTHRALASKVWGPPYGDAARVRTHIANVRTKLDPDRHRNLIRTETGVGYRFTRPEHSGLVREGFVKVERTGSARGARVADRGVTGAQSRPPDHPEAVARRGVGVEGHQEQLRAGVSGGDQTQARARPRAPVLLPHRAALGHPL